MIPKTKLRKKSIASDRKVYNVDYYNLAVIISVGYRVKSKQGSQLRIWAIGILKEYMSKGFALDDDYLKKLGGGECVCKCTSCNAENLAPNNIKLNIDNRIAAGY